MSRANLPWMSSGSAEKLHVDFSLQHYRFRSEPKGALQMPAYNKGSTPKAHPKGQRDPGWARIETDDSRKGAKHAKGSARPSGA